MHIALIIFFRRLWKKTFHRKSYQLMSILTKLNRLEGDYYKEALQNALKLINDGANLYQLDEFGMSSIADYALCDNQILSAMLQKGLNVNHVRADGKTLLTASLNHFSHNNSESNFWTLLEAGADLKGDFYGTVIHAAILWAASEDDALEKVSGLLEKNAPFTTEDILLAEREPRCYARVAAALRNAAINAP